VIASACLTLLSRSSRLRKLETPPAAPGC
jgi:hypothetical protein